MITWYADENGVWEWNEAPLDEFQADICRPGGMQLARQKLVARAEEYVFRPPSALVITGKVIDEATKTPIRQFEAIPGRMDEPSSIIWSRTNSDRTTDGTYRLSRNYGCYAYVVRIEADGYETATSREIKDDEGTVTIDFELKKARGGAATVLAPDGKPAAAAEVAIAGEEMYLQVSNGSSFRSTEATRRTADESGRFRFPIPGSTFQVVVIHPMGYANIEASAEALPNTIHLTAWARVEGTFRIGPETAAEVPLTMFVADAGRGPANAYFSHSAVTGPEGQFVFERVVPGTGRIGRDLSFTANDGAMEKESSSMVEVELLAGETTRLNLGGMGRAVIGRLEPPDGFTGKVLWNFARVDAAVPKWQKDKDANGWTVQTSRYDELRRLRPDITATVGWDGTFRLDDVKPGEYALDVRFSQHNAAQLTDYRFEVPASGAGEPLDLGILKLAPEP